MQPYVQLPFPMAANSKPPPPNLPHQNSSPQNHHLQPVEVSVSAPPPPPQPPVFLSTSSQHRHCCGYFASLQPCCASQAAYSDGSIAELQMQEFRFPLCCSSIGDQAKKEYEVFVWTIIEESTEAGLCPDEAAALSLILPDLIARGNRGHLILALFNEINKLHCNITKASPTHGCLFPPTATKRGVWFCHEIGSADSQPILPTATQPPITISGI